MLSGLLRPRCTGLSRSLICGLTDARPQRVRLAWTWPSFLPAAATLTAGQSPATLPAPSGTHTSDSAENFRWLEKNTTHTRRHLQQENAHCNSVLSAMGATALAVQLEAEIHARLPPPQDSLPERCAGGELLMQPASDGASQATYIRRPTGGTDPATILLDACSVRRDVLAAQASLGVMLGDVASSIKWSPDGSLLAYTVPMYGCIEQSCCFVRDVATGSVLPGGVVTGVGSMELAGDNHTLLFTTMDESGRPHRVVQHDLLSSDSPSKVVLREEDAACFVQLGRTKDGTFITVNINSKLSSEVHLLPSHQPNLPMLCVQARRPGLEYFVEHHHGTLLLLTNAAGGCELSLMACDVDSLQACQQTDPPATHTAGTQTNADAPQEHPSTKVQAVVALSTAAHDQPQRLNAPSPVAGSTGDLEWQLLVPHQTDAALTDLDVFHGRCVLYEICNGIPAVSVVALPAEGHSKASHAIRHSKQQVPLPSWVLHVSPGTNHDFYSPTLRLACSSPTHPPATYDYHFESQRLQLLHQQEAPPPMQQRKPRRLTGDHCTASIISAPQYTTDRMYAVSHDGVQVPITLVRSAPLPRHCNSGAASALLEQAILSNSGPFNAAAAKRARVVNLGATVNDARAGTSGSNGISCYNLSNSHTTELPPMSSDAEVDQPPQRSTPQPLLLLSYGAYGQPLELDFDSNLFSLIDRGWAVAYAHVRGGGELGRGWHEAGRGLHKVNSVHDYLACANHLIQHGHTKRGLIAARGISAGGLLVGAALNRDPGLFGAVVLRVGFLDLLTVMQDPNLPLTSHEYDEWGDPSDLQALTTLTALCPNHNLRSGPYPPVLASCALQDSRVPYWAPAKWVARLRRILGQQRHPLLLRVHEQEGHVLSGDKQVAEVAEEFAFKLSTIQTDR